MAASTHKILIKNMVCQRCIMTVETILDSLDIAYNKVELGEVTIPEKLTAKATEQLREALKKVGFELIESRVNKIIEDVKKAVIEYLRLEWMDRISNSLFLLPGVFPMIIAISAIFFHL